MSIHVVWSEYSAVLITTTCWSFQHELGDIQPADVALAVFDFTQNVAEIWRGSKIHQKRSILETLTLNCTLSDVTLVTEKRKPFDVLAKRADWKKSRGDCPSFEPWITVLVDTALSPTAEALVATRVVRLSA